MSAPVVGEVIADKYRVERVLGQGGMGVVLAARHLHLGQLVAIKCLLPEAAQQPDALARFVQEARTCAQLRSDHIVRVYDVGTQPSGAPFLVMELLDGHDLAHHLRTHGPLSVDDAVAHVIAACEGLAEAHEAGIVHRDLKPGNLFVVPRKSGGRGTVKILDFGISKLMTPPPVTTEALRQTAAGSLLGSPYYMSPEQIMDAAHVDARTDIWSLGVVLFELCAGRPPFVADRAPALLGNILSQPAPLLRSVRPEAPAWLETLLDRCLQKDPHQRFQSAIGLAHALAAGPAGDPLGATAPAPSSDLHADLDAIRSRRQHLQQPPLGPPPAPDPSSRPSVCLSIARPPERDASSTLGAASTTYGESISSSGRRVFLAGALTTAVSLAGFGLWRARRGGPVVIRGSSTLGAQLLPRWKPGLDQEGLSVIVSSAGTTRGLDALLADAGGDALAAASRRATPDEIARARGKLVEHLVGYDAIAIVTNVARPTAHLTLPQIRDLFTGRVRDWSELGGTAGPVRLLMRPEELGGHEALRALLDPNLQFVEGAEVVRTNDDLVRRLQADPQAVSFASSTVRGAVSQMPLGKDAAGPFVAPSVATVRQGTYPLVRPLLFYSWGKPRGSVQRFLAFAQGAWAQDALLEAGFIPLR